MKKAPIFLLSIFALQLDAMLLPKGSRSGSKESQSAEGALTIPASKQPTVQMRNALRSGNYHPYLECVNGDGGPTLVGLVANALHVQAEDEGNEHPWNFIVATAQRVGGWQPLFDLYDQSSTEPLLAWATRCNAARAAERLLEKGLKSSKNPLQWVTDARLAQRLRRQGYDVNEQFGSTGETTLHRAAARGLVDVMQTLLDEGALVGKTDTQGQTALFALVAQVNNLLVKDPVAAAQVLVGKNRRHVHHRRRTDNKTALQVLEGQLACFKTAAERFSITDYYTQVYGRACALRDYLQSVQR